MRFFGEDKDIKGLDRRYICVVFGLLVLAAAVYFLFFLLSASALDKKVTSELYATVEKTCDDIVLCVEDDVKMLSAAASLAEENNDSYVLSRLRNAKSSVDCSMLGLISRQGVFTNTDGQSFDLSGEECLKGLFEGEIVKGELIYIDGRGCFVSCAPVFSGNAVIGGICCVDEAADFYDGVLANEYITFALISSEGAVLGGELKESKNIGNILSAEGFEKYNKKVSEGGSFFIKEAGDKGETRFLAMPLGFNDCMLLAVVSGDEYNNVVKSYFYPALVLCIGFFGLTAAAALLSVLYFKRANAGLISQLERFSEASRVLGVFYLKHTHERPGIISYHSGAFAPYLGYEKGEIRGFFEQIIYSGDRNAAFRAFEEFYSSGEQSGRVSFRLEDKGKRLHWFSDYIMRDKKSDEIISLLSPIDNMVGLQGQADFMSRRLELVTRASAYYVFELNLKDMELFLSDNLKERLGYVITARDCFKDSVRERLISPHSRKELDAMIRSYRKGDKSIKGALTVISSSGEYVRFNVETEVIGSVINDDVRILAILNEIY